MELKYFSCIDDLVRALVFFEQYFFHCIECGALWINPVALKRYGIPPEEEFLLMQACVKESDNVFISVKTLTDWGLEDLTSGNCSLCTREAGMETFRKLQRKGKHFDCFGTAIDYCDQENCRYRIACVVGHGDLERWQRKVTIFQAAIMQERARRSAANAGGHDDMVLH